MSKIKKSLEENKEEILKALPKEFHENLEKEIDAAVDAPALSDQEELEAIEKELTDNPDVSQKEVIEGLLKNSTAHKAQPAPTEEEQKTAMEEALERFTK